MKIQQTSLLICGAVLAWLLSGCSGAQSVLAFKETLEAKGPVPTPWPPG